MVPHDEYPKLIESLILNKDGVLQVGQFVGAVAPGLSVWTTIDYIDQLIEGLKNKKFPKENYFTIIDISLFDLEKDLTFNLPTCPISGNYSSPNVYLDSGNGRKIKSNFYFQSMVTPLSNGLFDYDCNFFVNSTSYKKTLLFWGSYKTDHYLSIDIRTVPNWGLSGGWTSTRQNQETDYGKKVAFIVNHIRASRNVSQNTLNTFGENLILTVPGTQNSTSTGTSASHRGMGSTNYVRHFCN